MLTSGLRFGDDVVQVPANGNAAISGCRNCYPSAGVDARGQLLDVERGQ